jgi:hypothetical protein
MTTPHRARQRRGRFPAPPAEHPSAPNVRRLDVFQRASPRLIFGDTVDALKPLRSDACRAHCFRMVQPSTSQTRRRWHGGAGWPTHCRAQPEGLAVPVPARLHRRNRHISVRLPGSDRFMVTRHSAAMDAGQEDFLTFDLDGNRVAGAGAVPGENPMVPGGGIEPPRCCHRQILSLVRLPIPPSRQHEPIIGDASSFRQPAATIVRCGHGTCTSGCRRTSRPKHFGDRST